MMPQVTLRAIASDVTVVGCHHVGQQASPRGVQIFPGHISNINGQWSMGGLDLCAVNINMLHASAYGH